MTVDPESLYVQLGRLVESMPDFNKSLPFPASTEQWLARVYALVAANGDVMDGVELKLATTQLHTNAPLNRQLAAQKITTILYRTLAVAELRAPAAAQGAFIPAGNAFDALAALSKILGSAGSDLLIVDPYMDEKSLTDFAPLAAERVPIRLLADEHGHKATLRPAAERWTAQYGTTRPLEVRLTPARTLHDRLIIVDNADTWVLTQSLNAFATRSPASIVRVDNETASLKIAAYQAIWSAATPL